MLNFLLFVFESAPDRLAMGDWRFSNHLSNTKSLDPFGVMILRGLPLWCAEMIENVLYSHSLPFIIFRWFFNNSVKLMFGFSIYAVWWILSAAMSFSNSFSENCLSLPMIIFTGTPCSLKRRSSSSTTVALDLFDILITMGQYSLSSHS